MARGLTVFYHETADPAHGDGSAVSFLTAALARMAGAVVFCFGLEQLEVTMIMSDVERTEFEGMLRRNRCGGARARLWAGFLELYALPARRPFPADVATWLSGRGFVLREDPVAGPFWERPLEEEVTHG